MNKKIVLVTLAIIATMVMLTAETVLAAGLYWNYNFPRVNPYRFYSLDWNRCDKYVIRRPRYETTAFRISCGGWPRICQRFVIE